MIEIKTVTGVETVAEAVAESSLRFHTFRLFRLIRCELCFLCGLCG